MKRLIVGCGYLGQRVAECWLARGDAVHVVTRSDDRARRLAAGGLVPLVGDVTDVRTLPAFPSVDTVLWAVGHDRQSGRTLDEVYVGGLQHVLAGLAERTGRFVYVSSTGVYGQQDGNWVDEASLCEPVREGGRACLAAEQALLSSQWSERAVILRLAGIYGPGRLPRLQQLMAGEPLRSDPEGVINLIHIDDATAAMMKAADLPLSLPATYLIADGHPVVRRTFYQTLASKVAAAPPAFELPRAGSGEMVRSGSHKRVSNDLMVRELGVNLRYPSYLEGLAAIVRSERMGSTGSSR